MTIENKNNRININVECERDTRGGSVAFRCVRAWRAFEIIKKGKSRMILMTEESPFARISFYLAADTKERGEMLLILRFPV